MPIAALAISILAGAWATLAPLPAKAASPDATAITLIAGTPEETSLTLANDLAAALGEATRTGPLIHAMIGGGKRADMSDLNSLQSTDLAITQTDLLQHLKSAGTLGPAPETRIGILAKLHDAELHILAGHGIERVEDLAGRTVNLCAQGSGTEFTARAVFDRLGVKVRTINVPHQAGLAKVAAGEIAATMLVSGKPARVLEGSTLPQGVKLLGLPFLPQFDDAYSPATLTQSDYPDLIAQGERVDTLSVSVVLVAPMPDVAGTRNNRISSFVDTFFSQIASLHAPDYHPKWHDANLTASLAGWPRHPAAESWLMSHRAANAHQAFLSDRSAFTGNARQIEAQQIEVQQIEATTDPDPMLTFTQATRAANGNPAEQERLFRAFLDQSSHRQTAKTASTTAAP